MIKVGIIGCGRIAIGLEKDKKRQKPCTHLGAVFKISDFQIKYLCDIAPERLKESQKLFKISNENCFSDENLFLKNSEIDLLIIAVPTDLHYDLLKKALIKNIPLIVCEKPLCKDSRQASKIENLISKSSSRVIINHERRYSSKYRVLKRLIDGRKIGTISQIHAKINSNSSFGKKTHDPGILLHDGTHLIDLINYLSGKIETVQSIGQFDKFGREKWIQARYQTNDGINIVLDCSGISDFFHFEIDIIGKWGRIIVGNGFEKLYLAKDSPFYSGFKSLTKVKYPAFNKNESPFLSLYKEVQNFFKSKNKRKFKFQSDIFDGIQSIKIIDAIYKSARANGKKVQLK